MVALFDFLKRKKEVEKSKKPAVKKVEKTSVASESLKTKEKNSQPVYPQAIKRAGDFSYRVVREPHISEKATNLSEGNKYTFRVYANANKPEIKKSVEGIYGVDVLSVNVIKIPRKKRRLGRTQGFKKGFSKAIVTIKEGQKIEIL